jgi:hypothetical protein
LLSTVNTFSGDVTLGFSTTPCGIIPLIKLDNQTVSVNLLRSLSIPLSALALIVLWSHPTVRAADLYEIPAK